MNYSTLIDEYRFPSNRIKGIQILDLIYHIRCCIYNQGVDRLYKACLGNNQELCEYFKGSSSMEENSCCEMKINLNNQFGDVYLKIKKSTRSNIRLNAIKYAEILNMLLKSDSKEQRDKINMSFHIFIHYSDSEIKKIIIIDTISLLVNVINFDVCTFYQLLEQSAKVKSMNKNEENVINIYFDKLIYQGGIGIDVEDINNGLSIMEILGVQKNWCDMFNSVSNQQKVSKSFLLGPTMIDSDMLQQLQYKFYRDLNHYLLQNNPKLVTDIKQCLSEIPILLKSKVGAYFHDLISQTIIPQSCMFDEFEPDLNKLTIKLEESIVNDYMQKFINLRDQNQLNLKFSKSYLKDKMVEYITQYKQTLEQGKNPTWYIILGYFTLFEMLKLDPIDSKINISQVLTHFDEMNKYRTIPTSEQSLKNNLGLYFGIPFNYRKGVVYFNP